ncbi:diacylglycerol/lipid kinase family protein [Mucilaginibacter jinjuensis]|uniref:Diacylglycerol kinase family lipid kinase n=1 Tax=Mucilaginibacter jinjuensis TaxID=1176721 RepID=A0ABY7T280_9SPHI|nr:diacylglycerol kinase family protein [Mucilaginibacter jinjuensis]WCT10404.1 diacylglycerol kinase family lipid kinase [Mucilaginibacter jinjuensis]
MKQHQRIYLIINPGAGQDEPIMEMIDRIFHDSGRQPITVHVLEEGEQAADLIRKVLPETDLVAVYGGDGSVTEAAAALIGTGIPLAIIPGGTANVLAKELGIPQDTETALRLIQQNQYQLKTIDTGLVNNRSFLLRVNLGVMAEMITETDPDLKDKIGQLAYGVATIKSIYEAEPVSYQLNIDGETVNANGVSLTVTNSGSMGIGDLQLSPDIHINDGLLDVVLLKDTGVLSILKAAGSALFGHETDAVSHWACREVTITMPEEQLYLCDDCEDKATSLHIKVVPASLSVVLPLNS